MIDYSSHKITEPAETLVLEVTGDLNSSAAQFLLDCIAGYVERGEHRIVLDLKELDSISSEGLAILVRAHSRLKKLGGDLSIAGVRGIVADILHMVHFDRLFHLYPSVDDAVRAMA